MKDLYYNWMGDIRALTKKANSKNQKTAEQAQQDLIDLNKQLAHQVNQRLYRLEKKGETTGTAYTYAQQETGHKKPRYVESDSRLTQWSIEDLAGQAQDIANKLRSKTSTIRGTFQVENERVQQAMNSTKDLLERQGVQFTKENDFDYRRFKHFLDAGGSKILNKMVGTDKNKRHKYGSDQVLKLWFDMTQNADTKLTDAQFMKVFNEYENDLQQGRVNWNDLRTAAENRSKLKASLKGTGKHIPSYVRRKRN